MKTQALCQTKNKNQNGVCRAWTKMEGGEISKGIFAIPPFRARNRFYGEGGISTAQIKKIAILSFLEKIQVAITHYSNLNLKTAFLIQVAPFAKGGPFGFPRISLTIQNRIAKRDESKPFFGRIASHNSKKGSDLRAVFTSINTNGGVKTDKILTKKLKSMAFFGLKTIQKNTEKVQVAIQSATKSSKKPIGKSSGRELFRTKTHPNKIQK